jgi:hypothetical protein
MIGKKHHCLRKMIVQLFKELERPCKHVSGGAYVIDEEFENYNFKLSFAMIKNSP